MENIIHVRAEDIPARHISEHEGYAYARRLVVGRREGGACSVSVYEIPPGMSAYPYHCHLKNEEVFYILSGTGTLKTPDGSETVGAGDFLFFPANENGAHKLTNTSETEPLTYIDFDATHDLDACYYPDSGKVAVWGKANHVFKLADEADYFEGE